ncbi:hypothetical protein [Staphylococcus argenteus]|uniref:Uncharacterized protein n=1 Tax=Staphylococcus argenteus TaxID=985002 RepID=A0A7U7JT85_9STAP|nr:hypothetical protein [Staphylococcus argenteus]MDT2977430.1 hypothetical protein [Staphylococcus argenteus]MDT3033101.1 hypothetical protein [Staphylococcus argenteus]CRI08781.1 conserved hypothetical protein [Staphylococcus argenteus]CRI23052.1 conserved hypothetical protein [Staphylococcus argenteus]
MSAREGKANTPTTAHPNGLLASNIMRAIRQNNTLYIAILKLN